MSNKTDAELEAMCEKLYVIKGEMGDLFTKHDLDMGEVMSLLTSMLVSVALGGANVSPLHVIEVLAKGMAKYKELQDAEEEREGQQWLN